LSRSTRPASSTTAPITATVDQFAADLRRRNLIAELGIDLVHVEASMLAAPASVVIAVAQALQRHGWAGPIDLSALSL
jgi:hypothetical protein